AHPVGKALCESLADSRDAALTLLVRHACVAAEAARDDGRIAGVPQRVQQQTRHPPVARSNGMIRRLQRRIEGDRDHVSARAESASTRVGSYATRLRRSRWIRGAREISVRTTSAPAGPSALCRAGSVIRSAMRPLKAVESSAGARRPLWPSRTNSGTAETLVETTGNPIACASIRTLGRPSRSPLAVIRQFRTNRSASP